MLSARSKHPVVKRVIPRRPAFFAAVALPRILVLGSSPVAGQATGRNEQLPAEAKPAPQFTPEQVIELQIRALSGQGEIKTRVERCYRFASPANRAHTGPLDRFLRMVDSPPYGPLLNAKKFLVGRASVDNGRAHLLLTVVDTGGELTLYRCFLSRQTDGEFAGCWMTDAVLLTRADSLLQPPRESPPSKTT
jgi:hypothetical protein